MQDGKFMHISNYGIFCFQMLSHTCPKTKKEVNCWIWREQWQKEDNQTVQCCWHFTSSCCGMQDCWALDPEVRYDHNLSEQEVKVITEIGSPTWLVVTHSLEYSPFWEARNPSASQQNPCLLWNLKVHYHVHKSPPLIPALCQKKPIQILTPYCFKIHFNIILPASPGLPSGISPSHFLTKISMNFSSLLSVLYSPPISSLQAL
jgi:hypothetical protein